MAGFSTWAGARLASLVTALVLVLAACGGAANPTSAPAGGGSEVTPAPAAPAAATPAAPAASPASAACALITAAEAEALLGQATFDPPLARNTAGSAQCEYDTLDSYGRLTYDLETSAGSLSPDGLQLFTNTYGPPAGTGAIAVSGLGDAAFLCCGSQGVADIHVLRGNQRLLVSIQRPADG